MELERSDGRAAAKAWPRLLRMLGQVFYLGMIGYGGPTTLDYLHRIFVVDRKWYTEREFLDAVGWAQLLPGSTGASAISYLGRRRYGSPGALAFAVVFLTPSVLAMLVLSWAYFTYGQLAFVEPLFVGLGALVVALLLNATISLGRAVIRGNPDRVWGGLVIAAATFAGLAFFKLNVVLLILGAGILGIVVTRVGRRKVSPEPVVVEPVEEPRPGGAVSRVLPIVLVAAVAAALMLDPLTRTLFVSFFQVGLLAFGGGFASVALLQHVIVDQMQWLSFAQFRDGIALGQITPGPVLITATFAGFRVGGVPGSLAATVGIFLPPVVLTMLLADLHSKLARLPIVRAIVTGLQYGFVGLVAAITLRFGLGSVGSWQTWVIFVAGAGYLTFSRRSPGWAILATIAFSLVAIHP